MAIRCARMLWATCLPALLLGCTGGAESAEDTAAKQLAEETGLSCLSPDDMDRMSDQLVQLANLERTNAGLAPVTRVERLDQVATDFACRMVEHRFFAHQDPISGEGPAARASRANYRYYYIGENLAAGQTTAADVVRGWMASPDHRQIILSPKWRELGVGLRTGGEYGTYWVVEFAQPAKPLPPTAVEPRPAEPVSLQLIEPVAIPSIEVSP